MSFQIYRHEKHSKLGSLSAAASHMARTRPTPNADPARRDRNRVMIGSADPLADVQALLPAKDARGADGKLLRRSNSVLAIEVLLTASPEWWAKATTEQKGDWLKSSMRWLADTYGRANIAHLALHNDERTPHLTGFIVPLDPETGRLNARRWCEGRNALSEMQTSCAAAVAHLGLSRGIEGSTAKHERVKRHYGMIAQPVATLEVPTPPRILLRPAKWSEEQRKQVARTLTPLAAQAKEAAKDRTAAKAAKATATKAQSRAKAAEAKLSNMKKLADQVRELDLVEVLEQLGLTPDVPADERRNHAKLAKVRWTSPEHAITLDGSKWYDHKASKGGGGAIDLVLHCKTGWDFKATIAWLASRCGLAATSADLAATQIRKASNEVQEAVKERPPFTPPEPFPVNWPRVRTWLIETRGLPADAVDELHQRGDVYADERRNAVFLTRDAEGIVTGAELKGTAGRFTGMALGSSKAAGHFRLGRLAAGTVYLVESAIDAISLYLLRRRAGETDCAVVSTAGVTPSVPLMLRHAISAATRRVCAYDADEVGDRDAKALAGVGWERLRPAHGKDWNDELRHAQGDAEPPAPTVQKAPDDSDTPEARGPRL